MLSGSSLRKKYFAVFLWQGTEDGKKRAGEKRVFFDYIGNYAFLKVIIGILTYKLNTARLLVTIAFSVRRFWFKY